MRIEYHRTLLADRVRNAAFHAALQPRGRQGQDDGGRHRRRHRLPGLPGGQARRQARRLSTRRPTSPPSRASCCATTGCPTAASPRCIRPMWPTPDRVDVIVSRDARQLPVRGEHRRDAQRRARALPQSRRHHHSARRRAVRVPGDGRALLSRAVDLGRGRLRPRLRAGQGDDAQQHLRALVRSRAICSAAALRPSPGTSSPSTAHNKTTRSGEASWPVKKRTTVYGLALWWSAELADGVSLSTGPLDPRTHWEQLYLPGPGADHASSRAQTLGARLRSTTSYERGTNVTWTLTVRDKSGRERAAPGARPGEGVPAVAIDPSSQPWGRAGYRAGSGPYVGSPRIAPQARLTPHAGRCGAPTQSWMRRTASTSTLMLPGSEPMPTAERAWRPRSPSTATNKSEQPLITLGDR